MKPTLTRRYRRKSTAIKSDGAFFKKENQAEQNFFGENTQDGFFQPVLSGSPGEAIQRKCEGCAEEEKKVNRMEDKKEEEKVQRQPEKKEEEKVMKMEDKKEEEKLQKKENTVSSVGGKGVHNYVSTLSGKGQPLSPQANYFFSSRMGYDFSNVKLHTDNKAAESAKDINAKAYTIGNNIVFNEGQYNTHSSEGKKLMAHELAHIIQQNHIKKNEVQRKPYKVKGKIPSNTVLCLERWTSCTEPDSPGSWAALVIYHCPILIGGIIIPGTTQKSYVTIPDEFIGRGPGGERQYRCRTWAETNKKLTAADVLATSTNLQIIYDSQRACHNGFRAILKSLLDTVFAPSGGGPAGIRVSATLPVGGFPCKNAQLPQIA